MACSSVSKYSSDINSDGVVVRVGSSVYGVYDLILTSLYPNLIDYYCCLTIKCFSS